MARVAAQYAYMVSSDFESPEARYALGPYTPWIQLIQAAKDSWKGTTFEPAVNCARMRGVVRNTCGSI